MTESCKMSGFLTAEETEQVIEDLKQDEGYRNVIYLDSLGFRTFGIGHLIRDDDPEVKQPISMRISETRIQEAFTADLQNAIDNVQHVYAKSQSWPSEVKIIMVNMSFNLGSKLKLFTKLKEALEERDWDKAAEEMLHSKWYGQVGKRAERLVNRMKAVTTES